MENATNPNQTNEAPNNSTPTKFCKHCGKQINASATFCSYCGKSQTAQKAQPAPAQPVVQVEQKSKLVAALLAIFLGYLGIHNFYLGYNKKATTQLVLTLVLWWTGIGYFAIHIWAIIEAIQLFTGSIKVDGQGVPLKE